MKRKVLIAACVALGVAVAGYLIKSRKPTESGVAVDVETEKERRELTRPDATAFERFRALVRLGEKNDPVGREAALKRVSDPDVSIRSGAAKALGHFDDDEALKALLGMFNDKDESVRVAAVEALGSLPSIKREPTFDMLLNTPSLPEAVKVAACTAVLRGDMRANSREIATMLLVKLAREGHGATRMLAANQLMFMVPGHEEVQKVLREAIETGSDPEVAANATYHYSQQRDKWITERLGKLAQHPNKRIRMTAVRSVRYACPKDRDAILALAQKDEDKEIARVAVEEAKALVTSCSGR